MSPNEAFPILGSIRRWIARRKASTGRWGKSFGTANVCQRRHIAMAILKGAVATERELAVCNAMWP